MMRRAFCALVLGLVAAAPVPTLLGTSGPQIAGARLSAGVSPDPLSRFDARDLMGRRWTAERLRGRVVLLDFWATWCAPCLAEMPRLKALRERHAREDFEIVGVSLDAISRRSLVTWLNRHRIDWPQIHERGGYDGATARLFGIDRLPMTILIQRDGAIGGLGLRGDQLEASIDRLVGPGREPGRDPGPSRR